MICIKNIDGSFEILSDAAIKTLGDQLQEAIISYRYDKKLYRIANHDNCPKVEPAIMDVIWAWVASHQRLANRDELYGAMKVHPNFRVFSNDELGSRDEILIARIYNMWSSSFREVDVMLNLHKWTPKAQVLKDLGKDVKGGTDLIYRVNGHTHVFDVRHLGDRTDAHRAAHKAAKDNPDAIPLIASYATRGGELHLVPEKDYRHYAEIPEN